MSAILAVAVFLVFWKVADIVLRDWPGRKPKTSANPLAAPAPQPTGPQSEPPSAPPHP